MSTFGSFLKSEIARLSRKEVRAATATLKKASAQYRRHIAALKRQVRHLERQLGLVDKRSRQSLRTAPVEASEKQVRFVAKGLRSNRARLGLSAAEYGKLVGVTGQSIYNWEHGVGTPRMATRAKLATLRGISKKEAAARLQEAPASAGAKPGKQAVTRRPRKT
jgi:DNA-binding XRE family transcriptional regulator